MFLGIDCGTQGTKALVLDSERGKVLGRGAAEHSMISGADGRREQEPAQWVDALVHACHAALADAGIDGQAIRGVGVSGQQHGLVLLDAQGQVLRPAKLWCDTETTAENERLLGELGGSRGSLERLGLAIAPGYTVSKLLWTRERFPELFERIHSVLLPHDYLNFWLTGQRCSEYGDASGTGYFDVRQRQWDLALLDRIDPSGRLRTALPTLVQADQPIGTLRPQAAAQLGINPQALVASGGGDNMMAAIGTGNIQPGLFTMSLGSSGTVYGYTDTPVVCEEPAVATFCSSSGGWLPLICTMNLTNVTSAVRSLFELDLAAFNRCVAESPIGAEGVLMLPFLNGERVPALPHASGTLLGLTTTNLTQANLCRAAVEGTTFGLRYGLDLLRGAGMHSAAIRLVGGGAKSPVWRQLVADVMATPVVCTTEAEAAALGAAIQAAWCAPGEQSLQALCARCVQLDPSTRCEPDPTSVEAYHAVYGRYREQILAL
ncbi:xylulokinase [Pseudomonas sp. RIT-PI-S]|uniref:xylulokinase n=1 Tax=Pseudomonas sp. RIT-PI-S TaxID=3035295 RepID=UPI0021D8D8F0|nr:xylulokinase [Pseudomonas sp. RIT-PI-S]